MILTLENRPLENFYEVVPERLYAGQHPRDSKGFGWLIENGINSLVDLTEQSSYQALVKNAASDFQKPVEYAHFPIPDFYVPTHEQMKNILDYVDEQILAGRRLYVHCFAGLGRTGTVIGCYLIRHGESGMTVFSKLNELRARWNCRGNSPEDRSQFDFIQSWEPGA